MGMKGIRSVILIGLAACLAATSGLAREISSHSKSARSEKSSRSSNGKKKSSHASKSRKSKAKSENTLSRKGRASEEERYAAGLADLPPEDLPEPETGTEQASLH